MEIRIAIVDNGIKYMYKTISAISIIFIASAAIYLFIYNKKDFKNDKIDTLTQLKENNSDFKTGADALASGDTKLAIEAFTAAKNSATTKEEEAVAQFNIANAIKISKDRYPAMAEFVKLINDETLPMRTRALAMNEVFLQYRGYADINILQMAFGNQDITKLSVEDAEYAYLAKAYNLYPFAMSAINMTYYEMKTKAKNKEEVQAVYDKYMPSFEKSVVEMSAVNGERKYVTNSLLGKARVLTIMQKYNLVSKEDVEKAFEAAIQKTRELSITTTEQFSILTYADYEAGVGDIAKADALIAILSKINLSTMVKENLASTKSKSNYPALLKLKIESKSSTTQAFFKAINW